MVRSCHRIQATHVGPIYNTCGYCTSRSDFSLDDIISYCAESLVAAATASNDAVLFKYGSTSPYIISLYIRNSFLAQLAELFI